MKSDSHGTHLGSAHSLQKEIGCFCATKMNTKNPSGGYKAMGCTKFWYSFLPRRCPDFLKSINTKEDNTHKNIKKCIMNLVYATSVNLQDTKSKAFCQCFQTVPTNGRKYTVRQLPTKDVNRFFYSTSKYILHMLGLKDVCKLLKATGLSTFLKLSIWFKTTAFLF